LLRVIIDGPRDPQLNMAIDEAIFLTREKLGYNTLRLYMWFPSGVSIGRSQNIDVINLNKVRELGYKVVKRPTGGGALLHQELNEITYSVTLSTENPITRLGLEESSSSIALGIVNALEELGITGEIRGLGENKKYNLCYLRKGSSDVIVNGKKVSGSAQVRYNKALLQHGTLLLKFDPERFVDVIKTEYSVEELKEKVGGIFDFYGEISLRKIINSLIKGFSRTLGEEYFMGSLTEEEVELALNLYHTKYAGLKT
jgi:Lipoate-protein ligase A